MSRNSLNGVIHPPHTKSTRGKGGGGVLYRELTRLLLPKTPPGMRKIHKSLKNEAAPLLFKLIFLL